MKILENLKQHYLWKNITNITMVNDNTVDEIGGGVCRLAIALLRRKNIVGRGSKQA
jgi:hypothetical protein